MILLTAALLTFVPPKVLIRKLDWGGYTIKVEAYKKKLKYGDSGSEITVELAKGKNRKMLSVYGVGLQLNEVYVLKGKYVDIVYRSDRVISWSRLEPSGKLVKMHGSWHLNCSIGAVGNESMIIDTSPLDGTKNYSLVYEPQFGTWRKIFFNTRPEGKLIGG